MRLFIRFAFRMILFASGRHCCGRHNPHIAFATLLLLAPAARSWDYIQDGDGTLAKGASSLLVDEARDVISTGMLGDQDEEIFVVKHGYETGAELWRFQATSGCTGRFQVAVALSGQEEIAVAGGCRDADPTTQRYSDSID